MLFWNCINLTFTNMRLFENPASQQKYHMPPDYEVEEARDKIRQLLEAGELPYISVPEKYVEIVKKEGIHMSPSWTGHRLIVGTIGRQPYKLDDPDRRYFEVLALAEDLEPRFTGEDKTFRGVVGFKNEILPENIHEVKRESFQE